MRLLRTVTLLGAAAIFLVGCKSEVEEAVKGSLIDGDSAKFQDIRQCSGDPKIYTGQVNAKNRMGAFTGFEPFFYDGTSVAFAGAASFSALMTRCYQDLKPSAAETGSAVPEEPTETPTGNWATSEDVNPVDDTKTFRATLIADQGTSSSGGSIALTIRCQSNKTEMYVDWDDYLGDDSHDVYDEWKNVTVRVGKAEARTERWDISTDKKATFAPGSPVDLVKKMTKADRLVLQTTPYNENPIVAVFQMDGIGKAVAPIAKGCGWTF